MWTDEGFKSGKQAAERALHAATRPSLALNLEYSFPTAMSTEKRMPHIISAVYRQAAMKFSQFCLILYLRRR
jgi:hypothetical protein